MWRDGLERRHRRRREKKKKSILHVIKEEWKSVKPSILRYHRAFKRALGEDWI